MPAGRPGVGADRRRGRIPAIALLLGLLPVLAQTADRPEVVERGRYLVHAGGCLTCHTADRPDAIPLTGGRAVETEFGTFYTPNLTPDPVTGLANWTDADVGRALRKGVAPDGRYYYPVFPYPAYTGITDGDVAAIGAYLRSLKPVRQPAPAHELPWYLSSRLVMLGWNFLNFTPGRFRPDPSRDTTWNRGAYLVRHLGHCGECHTPRNALGGLDHNRELAGNPAGPDGEKIPGITRDPKTGIGGWAVDEVVFFLEIGVMPDGDFAGSSMSEVIDDSTGKLTPDDRLAIATYLLTPGTAPATEP